MELSRLHERARTRGVNPLVYWLTRAVLQPFFQVYFRLSRVGRVHIPDDGAVIFAANHRSFLDPFVIGLLMRRPIYYVAKRELFANRLQAWFLSSLGAFPVDRGTGDQETMKTARAILERGDSIVIFPEGTRVRPGSLGEPKRGVGRLALETCAPVVPVAVLGTEAVRRGWRVRPHKVLIRCGRPLTFPLVEKPSKALAGAVTDRIWPCVMLQWEWLGGLPPLRCATVIGAGAWGTSLATMFNRAGIEVQLGCRTREQAELIAATRENPHYLPHQSLPDSIAVVHVDDLRLSAQDLVCFAVPARALPAAVAEHGGAIPSRAGVLVVSKGLAPPLGTLPTAYVSERVKARAVAVLAGPSHGADALDNGAAMVVASLDGAFARQLSDALAPAGFAVERSPDVTGVELAGCAKNAAALAAAAAAAGGPNAAGAAAGRVFAEVAALARERGARPETFSGLAGTGDLVATLVAVNGRNRRAGEMIGAGVAADQVQRELGHAAEAVDSVPLLAEALSEAHVHAPAIAGLAALIEGRIDADAWSETVTSPPRATRHVRAA